MPPAEPEDIAAAPPAPLKPCRAAARPCASSSGSRQASRCDTGRLQCPPPAGSTPHEPGNPQSPPLCRSVLRVHGRPQRRSSKPASRKAPIGLESLSSGNSGLIAITAWRRNHSVRRVIRSGSLDDAVEIPIEPAAPLPRHPAASLPAGFRTTAPVRVAGLVVGPSSETLYNTYDGRPSPETGSSCPDCGHSPWRHPRGSLGIS